MNRLRLLSLFALLFALLILPAGAAAQDAGTGDNLHLLGKWGYGACRAVDVGGPWVLMGNGSVLEVCRHGSDGGLQVVGRVTLPSTIEGIDAAGDFAYVASRDAGLRIVDLTTPERPLEVGAVWVPDDVMDVAVSGGYAYVAADGDGLRVIDVSDPAAPVEVGFLDTAGYAMDLTVVGDYVYLADGIAGYWNYGTVRIIDVSDPTAPFEAAMYEYTGSTYLYAYCVAVANDRLYMAFEHGLIIVLDVSDPTAPTLAGSFDEALDTIYDMTIDGSTLYAAYAWTGLGVFDLTDPNYPLPVVDIDTPRNAIAVDAGGGRAYVADQEGGLQVFDVTVPAAPLLTEACVTPGNSHDVAVDGGWAYVADEMFGLRILDLRNRSFPHEEGALELPGTAVTVDVMDGYAYVAAASAGLIVVDVRDPAAPVQVAQWDLSGTFESVTAQDGYVYTTENSGPLRVFDVSDPTTPTLVGGYDQGNLNVRHTVLKDGYLLCAMRYTYISLWIFDVSDPTTVGSVATHDLTGFSWDIAVGGDTCYLSAGGTGVHILDVTDPAHASFIGTYDPSDGANGLETWGDQLFVAGGGRVWMLDVTDPSAPIWDGWYDVGGVSWEIAMLDGDLVVADHDDGVLVLRNGSMLPSGAGPLPARPLAAPVCRPNPCNPATTIAFTVPRDGPVRLDVLDAQGRRVARLVDRVLTAGPATALWRGRDDSGRGVASGVYFARVETELGVAVGKVVLVR